VERAMGIEPT